MRQIARLPAALAVAWLAAAPVAGQQHPNVERGFAAEKLYQFDVDQVNVLNGNVLLALPLGNGSYPLGGELGLALEVSYNSKVWDFEEVWLGEEWGVRSLPNRRSNAGLGFTLSLPRLLAPDDPTNETPRWVFADGSGAEHGFYPTLHEGEDEVAGLSFTRSGSYLRMREQPGGIRQVEHPDGTVHSFDAEGRLLKIGDRFGNYVIVTYPDATTWVMSDRFQRTHYVRFVWKQSEGEWIRVVSEVELAAFDGGSATWTFEYETGTIERACTDSFHAPGATVEVPLLKKLTLPDGSSWEATYYADSGGTCRQGAVASLTLPTGGRIEFTYRGYVLPTEGCRIREWARVTPGVATRRFVDAAGVEVGTWTYEPAMPDQPDPVARCEDGTPDWTPERRQTTVTTPLGDKSVYHFMAWPREIPSPNGITYEEYGLPLDRSTPDATGTRFRSAEHYDCDAAGGNCVLLRTSYVRYEWAPPCEFETLCGDSNRRLASQRTVYHDDGDRYADLDHSDFDGLGHYRQTRTGGNFPAANVRTTYTHYNPGYGVGVPWPADANWVLNTYAERWVSEGAATAKSQYCFESDTGFLNRVRIMKGTQPGAADVLRVYTRDDQGNLIREEYFGGDVQALSTSADLCSLPLPANQYRIDHTYAYGSLASSQYYDAAGAPLSFKTADLTIDRNTGLARESRDSAGLATTYEYDAMGRLVWVKPAVGHDAWTQYVYTAASSPTSLAQVEILRRPNGSETAPALARSKVHFDGFGRVWKEQRLLPGLDWSTREIRYNAMGWKSRESEYEVGTPSHWTEYLGYDPFGRPGTIRPPDGAAHDVTLTYAGVREVTRTVKVATTRQGDGTIVEVDSETTERYDRQGRLWQVTEPSDASGANVTTTYGYDVGNRLCQVSTSAGGVTQVRLFTYDHRGFLVSEQHPEKGPNGNGVVTWAEYDARGHAGNKVDTPHNLTYEYDRAERLVRIRETGGEERVLKSYTYAEDNGPGDWRNGKLQAASRYHYVSNQPGDLIFADGFESGDLSAWSSVGTDASPLPAANFKVRVRQSYVYGGKGGRVSQRDLDVTYDDTLAGESFTQSWTYNDLGEVASVSYPQCTFAECDAASPRTVTYGYTRGYLTSVPGYASAISYHGNGMVHQILHTNGITVTQAADASGMARPASITAKYGATVRWSTGDYQYDGAGNVTEIGTSWFLYDKVSRLTTATVATGPTGGGEAKIQAYTYDAFGNIQAISGTSGRATPTSSSTNRLEGTAVYDSAGNLTYWNGNVYEYDAFNQLSRIHTGGEEWQYLYTADDRRLWHFKLGASPRFDRWTLRDLSGKVLREYTATDYLWTVAEDYIYQRDQLLAAETTSGRHHFHLDHLGTPRLITDTNANQIAYHVYYPFGEEASVDPFQDQERMKFTGHERDLNNPGGTGDDLDYMMARHCNPNLGRFLVTDSSSSAVPPKPQSWNKYSYTLNNPLKFVDPDGRAPVIAPAFVNETLESNAAIAEMLSSIPVIGKAASFVFSVIVPTDAASFNDSMMGLGLPLGSVTSGGSKTAIRLLANAKSGAAFERGVLKALGIGRVGPRSRIRSLTGTASFRVPDAITDAALIEIKSNATKLRLTDQLNDFLKYAEKTGRQFILVVRQNTELSKELLELGKQGKIMILRVK